jgi:D-alanyl-D-alanine carboxypeptidase
MTHRRVRLAVATTLAALAVSTAVTSTSQAAPAIAAQQSGTVAERPAPIDRSRAMTAADRAAIDTEAKAFLADSIDHTPGLWLAVWDPKRGYYEQAYGEAALDAQPASTKDRFLIGSITKTVFATAVLEQVAAGRLKLTDRVKQLDPALAKRYPIAAKKTIAQLLGMTSRIPDYADPAVAKLFANPQQTFTRDQAIALGIAEGKAIPAPGGYSTTNYLLLGKVMKAITGKTPERLVNAVLRQAGMSSSRLMPGNVRLPSPRAHGYIGQVYGGQAAQVNPSLSATTDVTDWTMEWGKEGGGAYSTIGDLARWGSTCLGTTLLPEAVAAERLKTTKIDAGNYGLGVIREGDWLAHSGQAIGYEANVACNPKTGAVVAYAANSTSGLFDLSTHVGPAAWPEYAKAQASTG